MDVTPTLCRPFFHARANHAAVTVFAGLHDASLGRTTLYFALDNVSTGVLVRWDDATAPPMPSVSACGRVVKHVRKPRCHAALSLMCRVVVELKDKGASECPLQLRWASLSLLVTAALCGRPASPLAERVAVSAVAPFYLPTDATAQTAEGTLHEVDRWSR